MNASLPTLLLLLAVGAPLVTALLLAVKPWREAVRRATPVAALPAVLLAMAGPSGANASLSWLALHPVMAMDEVGRVFLAFTSVLWLASAWYASSYLRNDVHRVRFHVFFLLAMAGNFSLILAADLPTFYAGFAAMGLASAGLVVHQGNAEAGRAGRIYLALAMLGEVLILTGFVFLAVAGGTTQIAALHRGVVSQPALLLLLVGFGIKAGALSLHFWLPLAHPAAPVPASAVLSGAMIKAGLLGWIRFLPLGEATLPGCGLVLITAGLGAALLGTVVGVVQSNAKTVLAYSSISQMGIIMTGLGIGALRPAAWPEIQLAVLIYATHHALAKGALFLGIGPAHGAHTRVQRVIAAVGLVLPALALAGAPFTSGALAKTALKIHLAFLPEGWAAALGLLLPLAAAGTTLKMARFLWLAWPRGKPAAEAAVQTLWIPWLGLVAAALAGVWSLPGSWAFLLVKLTPATLWDATWPLLAGGALAALGAWCRRRVPVDLSQWLPAGDLGVLIERFLARLQVHASLEDHARREHRRGCGEPTAPTASAWQTRVERAAGRMLRVEACLCSWPVAGTLWLLWMAVLLGLLAA